MDDQQFRREQTENFADFSRRLDAWAQQPGNESLAELAAAFEDLARRPAALHDEAPALVFRLFTTAPGFAAGFPRDLLWYLGAECLHFMPDEEIERFTALDEDRRAAAARGRTFDWRGAATNADTLQ